MSILISKAIINLSKPTANRLVKVRTNYVHGSYICHKYNVITSTGTQKCYLLIEQFSHGRAFMYDA